MDSLRFVLIYSLHFWGELRRKYKSMREKLKRWREKLKSGLKYQKVNDMGGKRGESKAPFGRA